MYKKYSAHKKIMVVPIWKCRKMHISETEEYLINISVGRKLACQEENAEEIEIFMHSQNWS